MKKQNILFSLALVIVAIAFFAFTTVNKRACSIKGWITPKEVGISAWAFSQRDTFKTHITSDGTFEMLDIKPGTYHVVVQAAQPYKPGHKDGVIVTEGSIVDVGEVKLEK